MDLLILCCFGGVPFIQFPSSPKQQLPYDKIRHQWDPTDWVAIDVTDSLLYDTTNNNSSSIPSLNPLLKKLLPSDIPTTNIDKCDLWNLTFASGADKHLFRKSHGKLKCRCPLEFIGIACQQQKIKNKTTPFPSINLNLTKQKFKKMALIGTTTSTFSLQQGNSFIWFLLVFMVLALIMVTLFMVN
uniref:EGF-like domain-containing protein n=1 Tax=Meloidogyne hapla TaxID=6305 RepID=A0A1I8BX58_MELHA